MSTVSAELKKGQLYAERKNFITGITFVLPSLAFFCVFVIYPFVRTIVQSLYLSNNRGMLTVFNGIQNYVDLFSNEIYWNSVRQTILYTLLVVPSTIIIALFLAVISNNHLKGIRVFNILFSSTMGISVAAGSVFWNFLFHPTIGFLNQIVIFFGAEPIGWLTDSDYALFSVAIVSIWMNTGFCYLILMGGMKNIDNSYYESADIVGLSFFSRLKKITIPLLSPSLFFVFITSIINSFQTFGVVDMLTQGGPERSTNFLVYGLYDEAFVNFQYGSASAQGVVLFLIIFIISMLQMKLTEKWVTYQ